MVNSCVNAVFELERERKMNGRKKEAQVSEDSLFMHLIGFDIVKVYPSSLSVLAVSQAPLFFCRYKLRL